MRTTQFLLATLKETPADAEIVSHQLMLRAGLIRKLSSGIYTWLPLGLRVLHKVCNIVREEMNRCGAQEVLMPSIQPAELWKESHRWDQVGKDLLKIKDRHDRDFCYGPTHEEVITDIARHELRSYKQLPLTLYQIQTKFRDEIRPRFGVMRSREFLMKDAYSFHENDDSLEETYQIIVETYCHIFDRLGLTYRTVLADSGNMGGKLSHEFHVLAQSGEDAIVYSDQSDYAANVETAEALIPEIKEHESLTPLELVDTPEQKTIQTVCTYLNASPEKTIKTLLVHGTETPLVALILRGDHQLNEIKASKLPHIATPLTFATDQEIKKVLHLEVGYIGPIGLSIPTLVDRSAAVLTNFICGANQPEKHYINANWKRDATIETIVDIRNAIEGDPSPDGKGHLQIARGIEVGHVFQLGKKYSNSMSAGILNEKGKTIHPTMGCYGLGISRVIAAAIEQNHDEKGIIWPQSMAPFDIILIPIGMKKSERVRLASESIYKQLSEKGYDVLFDDRDERPGVMFANAELIGIPTRLVISDRGLNEGTIEAQMRHEEKSTPVPQNKLMTFLEHIRSKQK